MSKSKKFELDTVPLKEGAYEKPERNNKNIPEQKYDKVDKACASVRLGNDGNVYIPEANMGKLLDKKESDARYIVDNRIEDMSKKTVNNQVVINSSAVVGYMDEYSHQTRNAEEADLYRYGRDSLIRIGDSDQAEAIRRKTDAEVSKRLRKLRDDRGTTVDEITGEELLAGAEFHHKNKKSIYNNAEDVVNPDMGINVNKETHKEIHKRGIVDEKQLEEQKESIKETLKKRKEENKNH